MIKWKIKSTKSPCDCPTTIDIAIVCRYLSPVFIASWGRSGSLPVRDLVRGRRSAPSAKHSRSAKGRARIKSLSYFIIIIIIIIVIIFVFIYYANSRYIPWLSTVPNERASYCLFFFIFFLSSFTFHDVRYLHTITHTHIMVYIYIYIYILTTTLLEQQQHGKAGGIDARDHCRPKWTSVIKPV